MKLKKPQLAVGQHWCMPDGGIVRVTGWGTGGGMVNFVPIDDEDELNSMLGKDFRVVANIVLEHRSE